MPSDCARQPGTGVRSVVTAPITTPSVDAELLGSARVARSGITDAALIDEALTAFLARHRSAEIDASYAAYDEHPVDEADEWGDPASWRRAAGAS